MDLPERSATAADDDLYAAFGGKTAMVSFLTSPKDVDKVLPFADATVQSMVLPPSEAPERFGKTRADLNAPNWRTGWRHSARYRPKWCGVSRTTTISR